MQYGVVSCVLNADGGSTTGGLLRVWSFHSSIEGATATAKKLSTCSEAMRQIDFVVVDLSQWIPCLFDAQDLQASTAAGAGAADSKAASRNKVDVVYTDHLYGSIMQGRIAKQLNDISTVKARSEADNKQLTPVDLYDMAVTKRSNDLLERVLGKLAGDDAGVQGTERGVSTRSKTKKSEQLQKALKEEIEKSRGEAKDYVGMLMREANRKQKIFAEKMRKEDMNTLKSVEMEQKSKLAATGNQQSMLMTSNASGSTLAMPF